MIHMNTAAATTAPVAIGATIFDATQPNGQTRRVVENHSADRIPSDWFVAESHLGYRTYCRFTGRTRRCWGISCPTVERYEIDTIADVDGVIYGVAGARIPGTYAVRPELCN